MQNASLVSVLHGLSDLLEASGGLAWGKAMAVAGFEFRFQAAARDVLHREVRRTGVLLHFVDGDNVGVAELGYGLGLTLETLAVGLAVAVVLADQLERHDPPD